MLFRSDEEMRKRYKLLLQLKMVEMVRDLDLLGERQKASPEKKPEVKK